MNPIFRICKQIRNITDEHFKEVMDLAETQANYIHPLKGGKQKRLNTMGDNNLAILHTLSKLRTLIRKNEQKK